MARLRVNWKLLIVLVLTVSVLGVTVFALRGWNRSYKAKMGLEKGLAAYEKKQWQDAATYLGQYLPSHQEDTAVLLKYAQAALNIRPAKQGNINQAINAYRVILLKKDDLEAAKNLIGIYLWVTGMPGEGQLTAERFLEKQDNLEVRQLLAACLSQQKQYDKAIEQINRVITQDPSLISGYDLLSQVMMNKGSKPGDVEAVLQQAIDKNPQSAMAYIQRANYYLRTDNKPKAIEDLTKAGQLKLDTSDQGLISADLWLKAGRSDEARRIIEDIQTRDSKNASLWSVKARLALAEGKPDAMAAVAEEGIKTLDDAAMEFLPVAAELFINASKTDRAKDCVAQMRKSEVNETILVYLEGLIAEKEKDWALAAQSFRKAYDLGRKDEETAVRAAGALSRAGDLLTASQVIGTFLTSESESFRGHLVAGELASRQKQWTIATEHLKKAILLNPSSAEASLLMLQVRMQRLSSSRVRGDSWDALIGDISAILARQDTPAVRVLLFQAALQGGQKDVAKQQLDNLKKNAPDQARTILAEAEYLSSENQTAQAVELLKKSVQANSDWDVVRALVMLLVRQTDAQGAVDVLNAFIGKTDNPQDKFQASLDLGDMQMLAGKRDAAYDLYKSLLKTNPGNVAVLRKLLDIGQATEKTDILQGWIDQYKQSEGEQGRQWRYEQARLWFTRFEKQKYYAQTIDLLNEAIRLYPEDKQCLLLLASVHEASAHRQLALKSYLEALSRDPEDLNTAVPVIAALYRNNEYQQGYEILTGLVGKGYQDSRLTQLQMEYLMHQGQLSSVSDILEKELQSSPNDQDRQLALALVKIREKDFSKAGELIDQILKAQPDFISAIAAKVQWHLAQDQKEKALELCSKTVEKMNNSSSYILRAQTYIGLGQFEPAKKDIESLRAVLLDKEKERAFLICAQLYSAAGDQVKAMEDVQKALREGIDKPVTQRSIAQTLSVILQRVDMVKDGAITKQAEQILKDLLAKDDMNAQAAFTLAMMYHNQERLDEAMQMYEKTLALDPAQAIAANNMAWLLSDYKKNPQKALELANKTLQITPDYADLIDTRGSIYVMLGDYPKAVDDFKRALPLYKANTPQGTATRYRLGKALAKYGQTAPARQELEAAARENEQTKGLTAEELKDLNTILAGLSR